METSVPDPEILGKRLPDGCPICGGKSFGYSPVLWQSLIDEWQLSEAEASYINVQQGLHCTACSGNLRSMVLARAICAQFAHSGTFQAWIEKVSVGNLSILEINEAGMLTPHLSKLAGHYLAQYPEHEIHRLTFDDGSFDLVLHSDTLEHVADPVHALAECRRVLRWRGILAFTVPVVIGRLTRSRAGLPSSYHGSPEHPRSDFLVHTEFGADFWTAAIEAGFETVTLHSGVYPAGLALTARK